jgi:hypothetical protein
VTALDGLNIESIFRIVFLQRMKKRMGTDIRPKTLSGVEGRLSQGGVLSEKYWAGELVKSSDRVRDAGEVFTPFNIIEDMLDLLPKASWNYGPSKTFLEPSCGNGRFLVVILYRKFAALRDLLKSQLRDDIKMGYALEALSSIYGIDISEDNILGHENGDNDGARKRLLEHFRHLSAEHFDAGALVEMEQTAEWILEHNILVGNMLGFDSSGKLTNRDSMPIPEYLWDLDNSSVEVRFHTWSEIEEANRSKDDGMLDIFGAGEPRNHWQGNLARLGEAPRITWNPKGIIRRGAR